LGRNSHAPMSAVCKGEGALASPENVSGLSFAKIVATKHLSRAQNIPRPKCVCGRVYDFWGNYSAPQTLSLDLRGRFAAGRKDK